MKLGDVLNNERVGALCGDKNAYISNSNLKDRKSNVDIQSAAHHSTESFTGYVTVYIEKDKTIYKHY